jgi:hypothetical protein
MKLSDCIAELRLELGDHITTANPQGKRYSNAFLTRGLNNGLQLAYNFRKDLFTKTAVVQATPGDLQQPPGFDRISRVDGLTDACGNLIKRLFKTQAATVDLYPARRCASTPAGTTAGTTAGADACPTPDSYTLDTGNAATFTATPPVQGEVFYRVTGSVAPEPYSCDVDQALCHDPQIHIVAMHYARYFAYATESESATSRALAQENLTVFFRMLKIFKDEDKSYCKDFCKP